MRVPPLLAAFAALLCTGGTHASQTLAAGAGAHAGGAVRMAIQVPRLLHMRLSQQPRSLEITGQDLARGYVVARGLVEVLSTHRDGYQVRALLAHGPVVEAELQGLERPVTIASGQSAPTPMPSMVGRPRPAPYPVEYRLRLAPGTQPGTYAWPVALSVEAP